MTCKNKCNNCITLAGGSGVIARRMRLDVKLAEVFNDFHHQRIIASPLMAFHADIHQPQDFAGDCRRGAEIIGQFHYRTQVLGRDGQRRPAGK